MLARTLVVLVAAFPLAAPAQPSWPSHTVRIIATSPPGGSVRVFFRHEGEPRDTARRLKLLVEDDGPGIPPDTLEKVFDRFYTSRPKDGAPGGSAFGGHSGLGLAISRQIAQAHGGALSAENRLDATGQVIGARFTLDLPEA